MFWLAGVEVVAEGLAAEVELEESAPPTQSITQNQSASNVPEQLAETLFM